MEGGDGLLLSLGFSLIGAKRPWLSPGRSGGSKSGRVGWAGRPPHRAQVISGGELGLDCLAWERRLSPPSGRWGPRGNPGAKAAGEEPLTQVREGAPPAPEARALPPGLLITAHRGPHLTPQAPGFPWREGLRLAEPGRGPGLGHRPQNPNPKLPLTAGTPLTYQQRPGGEREAPL